MIRPALFTSVVALALIACTSEPSDSRTDSPSAPSGPAPGSEPTEPTFDEAPLSKDEETQYDPEIGEGRTISDGEVEQRSNPALAAALAPVRENGARAVLDLDPERFASLAVLRIVDEVPASSVQQSATGGSYLVHDTGARRIIVSSGAMPPEPPTDDDVVVNVSVALSDVRIEQRFERSIPAAGGAQVTKLSQVAVETMAGAPLGLTNVTKPSAARDCIAEAWALPPALPPMTVVNPEVRGCSIDRCVQVRRAWLVAQHDLMRAYQMLEFIGEHPAEQRAFFWKQRAYGKSGASIPGTSPAEWFGSFSQYRFDAIRQVVHKLYSSFKEGKHYSSGATIKLICPIYADNPGNICFSKEPSAHHAVAGFVNFCERYFSEKDDWQRGRLMSHEVLHHTWVSWKNGIGRIDPVRDIHYHAHSNTCLSSPKTSAQYGPERIEHLATYLNGNGGDCNHRDINFRNNDTYAYFARTLGEALLTSTATVWPAESPPKQNGGGGTNNPPEGCSGGGLEPPPPGGDWQDPSTGCQKQGGELVCPSSGGGGGFGGIPNNLLDLKIICPEN